MTRTRTGEEPGDGGLPPVPVGRPGGERLDGPVSTGTEPSGRLSGRLSEQGGGQAGRPASGQAPGLPPARSDGPAGLSPPLRVVTRAAVVLCAAVSLVHVLFVFLYVAPSNQISQRYARQIQAWIYPVFEQNWRLFAPEPQAAVPQISVRTLRTTANGPAEVSGWFDLTAVDNAAVRHHLLPSHTAQNMLRRAWTGYLDSHGDRDRSSTERAAMWQEYLRNIAVDRITAARHSAFTQVQLRVRTRPVMAYDAAGRPRQAPPAAVATRYLPWWKATAGDD